MVAEEAAHTLCYGIQKIGRLDPNDVPRVFKTIARGHRADARLLPQVGDEPARHTPLEAPDHEPAARARRGRARAGTPPEGRRGELIAGLKDNKKYAAGDKLEIAKARLAFTVAG